MPAPTELRRKLQIKSGARLLLINVPEAIAEELTAGAEVEPVKPGEACDGVIAFCANAAEVSSFAKEAVAALPPDGLLWLCYRKGDAAKQTGLSRDEGWQPVFNLGFRPVRSIAIDETWTGLRFRETARIKSANNEMFAPRN
jgi:hypothetical protein